MGLKPALLLIALLHAVTGCSTVTIPVLRHETGETLGSGKFKASARIESSRMFPVVPAASLAATAEQRTEVFQSSLFGFGATAGILPRVDVQIGGFLSVRGGGWRLGGKYQIGKKGNWSLAGTAGYGAFSSSGTITFETGGYTQDLDQVLSVKSFDLAAPVSYRFSPGFAAYSGLMLIRSGVNGTVSGTAVSEVTNDLGVNLGGKVTVGRYDGDLELAFLRLYDPFSDSMRFVPFMGISGSVNF